MGARSSWVHLNTSKASDRVWHDGLIFKQRQNGICGEMINILEEFLCDRNGQFLDGQCSPLDNIRADDPFWDLCYFQYTTIYQIILKVNANRLLRHIFVFCSS